MNGEELKPIKHKVGIRAAKRMIILKTASHFK